VVRLLADTVPSTSETGSITMDVPPDVVTNEYARNRPERARAIDERFARLAAFVRRWGEDPGGVRRFAGVGPWASRMDASIEAGRRAAVG